MAGYIMTGQQAVRLIDRVLAQAQQQKLNDLQSTIVLQTWDGNTYRSIADRLSYDLDYIKQIAARLWKSLSSLLGENICKSNMKSVLERSQELMPSIEPIPGQICNWEDLSDSKKVDLKTIETWMISDRITTVAFLGSGENIGMSQSLKLDLEVQNKIESLMSKNSSHPIVSNVLMNEILSVLTVNNSCKNSVNCLIVNSYFDRVC